jgi:hypothetical protein
MKKGLELRDMLSILLLIMLIVNAFLSLRPQKAVAETFRLDDCITSELKDKPAAYLHVVAH